MALAMLSDTASSTLAFSVGLVEHNPFMVPFAYNPLLQDLVKLGALLLILTLVLSLDHKLRIPGRRIIVIPYLVVAGMFMVVTAHNLILI